jgi:hypothetical protein
MGNPNNWYNDNTLNGAPGGQPAASAQGWTGTTAANNGSKGWVKVKHRLTGLGGQSSVLLRIAFGSDAATQDNGFAFDEIRIGDNTNNLAVNSIVPITKLCGFSATEPVTAIIENLGPSPVSGFSLSCKVDGGPAVTQPFTGTLDAGAVYNFTFTQTANLQSSGPHTIEVTVMHTPDPEAANNVAAYTVTNTAFASLPPVIDFEPAGTGINMLKKVTNSRSAIIEDAGAGNGSGSTKGLVMDGVNNAAWVMPVGITDPWASNPEHYSVAYICFNPSGGPATSPLWLSFDLKQLFKVANANTNFRVTVNGTAVGGNTPNNVPANTYRPPFTGTPIQWQRVNIDLSAFKNLTGLQIGLESSVREQYANGAGTANLIDNITISRSAPNVGIRENVLASQLHVMPNPSTGNFLVSLPEGKTCQLEVTDLTGKHVMRQEAKGDTQLNLEKIAKGIYLLKVSNQDGSAVRKLILE